MGSDSGASVSWTPLGPAGSLWRRGVSSCPDGLQPFSHTSSSAPVCCGACGSPRLRQGHQASGFADSLAPGVAGLPSHRPLRPGCGHLPPGTPCRRSVERRCVLQGCFRGTVARPLLLALAAPRWGCHVRPGFSSLGPAGAVYPGRGRPGPVRLRSEEAGAQPAVSFPGGGPHSVLSLMWGRWDGESHGTRKSDTAPAGSLALRTVRAFGTRKAPRRRRR